MLKRVVNFLLITIKSEDIIILSGDIGSGKTSLIREISRKMGNKKRIISPSFNKMFVYQNYLCHIDCYNIEGKIDNLLEHCEGLPVFIEWGENCLEEIDTKNLEIRIKYQKDRRSYTISRFV